MMKTAVAILLSGALVAVPGVGRQSVADVAISYSVPIQPLTLHQPVILKFSLKNNADQTVTLDLGQDRKGSFELWVTPPNGERRKLPQYRSGGISALGNVSVQPGETFSQNWVLNEWYEFLVPGTYHLEGRLTQPILVNNGSTDVKDPGFQAVIEIGPRDEVTLAADCDSLANRIEDSQTYEDAAQAALALRYVHDPVAVPYLRRALFARKLVESIIVPGLEEIGDDEAVLVLGSALQAHLPGHTTILAKAALERLEQRTQDPARKEAIKRILEEKDDNR